MAVTLTATAIRQDIVARLLAAGVAGGAGHVFDSELIDPEAGDLPLVTAISDDPTIDKQTTDAMLFLRTEKVGIYGLCTATTNAALAQAVDDLEDAIEAAIIGDPVWGGSFQDYSIQVQKNLNLSSKRRVGGVSIILTLKYRLEFPVAAALLTGLEKIVIAVQPIDPDGADLSPRIIEATPP